MAPSVLYALAKPSVSDEQRQSAIEKIQAGEIETVADVKAHLSKESGDNRYHLLRNAKIQELIQPLFE